MTEKEKAKELILKYYNYVSGWTTTNKPHESPSAHYEGEEMKIGRAKQCALIAVDEIIELPCLTDEAWLNVPDEYKIQYWRDVKKEIEKL